MAHSDGFNGQITENSAGSRQANRVAAEDLCGDFRFDAPVNGGTAGGAGGVRGINTQGRATRSGASRSRRSPSGSISLSSASDFFGRISPERWVDIVCIPVTLAGLIFIIVNFEAILEALFSFLYPIIEGALAVLLFAAAVLVLYLIFRRRRRRFYW